MSDLHIEGHVLYALRNAVIKEWPFPHFLAENVFPEKFYTEILKRLTVKEDFKEGARSYEGRKFSNIEIFPELAFMEKVDFLREVAKIFQPWMKQRYQDKKCVLYSDTRLIRDPKGYSIGPHTDAAWKVSSLLFYLAQNYHYKYCGTSIYLPKDRNFTCPGGPHHPFENFDRIYTVPYFPNSCLGFFKTENSFHGVEPLEQEIRRDVLLYNIYDKEIYLQMNKPKEAVTA